MRCLILSCHSEVNEPLARLTAENKWDYTARHGYDLLTLRHPWEYWRFAHLDKISQLLPLYDTIMSVGSDVLFMNHRVKLTDVLLPTDNIIMARESLGDHKQGWSMINNDVMIWRNTPQTKAVIDRIIAGRATWINCSQLWQWYLSELLFGDGKEQAVIDAIRLVEPRVMNAAWLPGPENKSQWQMGDWIFHAVCGSNQQKFEQCAQHLKLVT